MVAIWFHLRGGLGVVALTIKSIPEELYRSLKDSAKAHRRSINSEVIACLERTLGATRVDPAAFLAHAESLRRQVHGPKLTDRVLRTAKEAGRP